MPSKSRKNEAKDGLAEAAPHYLGHRERLRERFLDAGPDAVTEYELLELVLFRAIPRRDVKPLAKALIAKFGSFARGGVGAAAAAAARSKGWAKPPSPRSRSCRRRRAGSPAAQAKKRTVLSSWSAVLDYCRTTMAFADKEQFRVIFLDKRNQIIADEVQQTGTVDHTPVYPREVVKRALELIRDRDHPGAQPSVRRSDAVARRHPDDAVDRRDRQAARHFGARPHHRRQGRPRQLQGVEADLGRQR